MSTVEEKKKGVVEFIPLALGLVIAIIILAQVGIPVLNGTLYRFNLSGGDATTWAGGYSGATGSVLTSVMPLFAVSAIAVIAVGLMALFANR